MSISVKSINVGKPITFTDQKISFETGIFKNKVSEPIFLGKLNFEGDGQADLKHHGGKDKAVCVYPYEHYTYWNRVLELDLPFGAFGENITVQGMLEEDVCIGDVFGLGEAIVQITQPREPCYKIAKRYNRKQFPLLMQTTGYTGYYLSVLQEGVVDTEWKMKKLKEHPAAISISYANDVMYHNKENVQALQNVLAVAELSERWRKTLMKRLEVQIEK